MNVLMISGNLGKDPENRFTPSGRQVVTFDVASSRKYKNSDGVVVEAVEWTRVETWGKLAEVCAQYLAKGKKVLVIGRKQTDRSGEGDTAKYFTKLVADSVEFLSPANGGAHEEPAEEVESDEIPF